MGKERRSRPGIPGRPLCAHAFNLGDSGKRMRLLISCGTGGGQVDHVNPQARPLSRRAPPFLRVPGSYASPGAHP